MNGSTVTAGTTPVGAPEWTRRQFWASVGVLGIGAIAIGTDSFVVAGVLGGVADDLGVTTGAAGLTVTAFAAAFGIGAPVLSALVGARRLRSVLIGSLVLFDRLRGRCTS